MFVAAAIAGALLYGQHCASCHGADLRGSVNAPSIRGAGAAQVDFWVGTGRMPAALPWVEEGHRRTPFTREQIDALIAYVTSVQPGGAAIPVVLLGGDPRRGRTLFEQNCEHCHGAYAQGASIGSSEWAPSLRDASRVQLAEAVRIGPGQMPPFGEQQLGGRDLDDVAAYVESLDAGADRPLVPLTSSGPVPEGLLGWLAVGLLIVFAFGYSRSSR